MRTILILLVLALVANAQTYTLAPGEFEVELTTMENLVERHTFYIDEGDTAYTKCVNVAIKCLATGIIHEVSNYTFMGIGTQEFYSGFKASLYVTLPSPFTKGKIVKFDAREAKFIYPYWIVEKFLYVEE